MISKYNNFTADLLLEKAINESFLYYSPNVRKALSRIKNNDIASELLRSEGTDIKPDMTFIDLAITPGPNATVDQKEGKEGYLSFITMRNAKTLITARFTGADWAKNIDNKPMPNPQMYSDDIYEFDLSVGAQSTGVFTKSRNEVGLGKFVNKIFPGKYNDKQREEFVNLFKSSLDKAGEHFEIVEGEDIEFWYSSKNYKSNSGILGNSCMASKSGIFGIYTQNQDVCKLLILKEDDKILGRALIWKLNSIKKGNEVIEGLEYFMDRQYTIKDSDVQKFIKYAKEKGWCYRSYNNHYSYNTVTIDGEEKHLDMIIKVATKDYKRYPYMDTFKRYDVSNGLLYNNGDNGAEYEGQYILEDTGGGYYEIEGGLYSEWYDSRIPEDEAVWSEPLSDYLILDRSVEVIRGDRRKRGWYPDDYDDIFFDEDHDEYFHVDNGVWSDIEGRMLFGDDAVMVVTEIFDNGDVPRSGGKYMYEGGRDVVEINGHWKWYDKISDKFEDWRDYSCINKRLLVNDYLGKYIPKKFAIEVYEIKPIDNALDMTGVKYLTKVDALGLGYNIVESEKRITDWFSYTETISEYTDILLDRLSKLISRYNDVLNNKGQLQLQFKGNKEQEYRDGVSINLSLCQDRIEHLQEGTWD